MHGRYLLPKGLRHMVGNGQSLSVWSSPWLVDGDRLHIPLMKNILIDLNLKVSDLLIPNSHVWDIQKLEELFYQEDINLIQKIKPVIDSPDFFCWNHTKSGDYAVRSGYWFAEKESFKEAYALGQALPSLNGIKDSIWSMEKEPKIRIFLWKAGSGALSVEDNLINRGMKVDSRCQICGLEGESINHVLFTCTAARNTWASSNFPVPINGFDLSSIYSNIYCVLKMRMNQTVPISIRRSGPWILWSIWKNMNSFLFENRISLGPSFIRSIYGKTDHCFLVKAMENKNIKLI